MMLQGGSVVCARTAVVKSKYSRLNCHEYDTDKAQHLALALDTNRSFVAIFACADASFCCAVISIVPISPRVRQVDDNLKDR